MAKGRKTGGRTIGTPNKLTATVKEAFEVAFAQLQGHPTANLSTWAGDNPTEFYKLASKLIPAQVNANVQGTINIINEFAD